MSNPEAYDTFVIVPPGLEAVAATELRGLGVRSPRVEEGGVAVRLSRRDLYRVNLEARVASRVIVRLSEFHADSFHELERRARRVAWHRFLTPDTRVNLRVTCRKSRLYHSDAVSERIAGAIGSVAGNASLIETGGDADDPEAGDDTSQLVIVRVVRDVCSISVDSSGAHLHRRGYRLRSAKAPIRENLAAGFLRAAGWTPEQPLLDPFCGAGTFLIEAALIARRIPPGLRRPFQFERWPDFDAPLWRSIREDARSAILPETPAPLSGSDENAGALRASRENAERAGVATDIALERADAESLGARESQGPGWVVCNPPYGVRVGGADMRALRGLYLHFGNALRAGFRGWKVALVSGSPALDRLLRLPLAPALTLLNGGVRVRLMLGRVPSVRATRRSADDATP